MVCFQSIFSEFEGEDDEDLEIEKITEVYKKKGGVVIGMNLTYI